MAAPHAGTKSMNGWSELFARVSSLEEGPPALLSRVHASAVAACSSMYGVGGSGPQQLLDSAAAAAAAGAKGYGYDMSEALLPAAAPAVSFGVRDGLAASLARYTRECRRLRSQGLLVDGVALTESSAAAAIGAPDTAAAPDQEQRQQERLVGLDGNISGIDVAAFRGLRRLYQSVAAEARSAAEASQQQLLAAVDMEQDLKCWAAKKAALMQQLALSPAAADALAYAATPLKEAPRLNAEGQGYPQALKPHPLLTDPELQLLYALPSIQQLQQQEEGRGLASLLQQLPAAAAAAAAAATVEPERQSADKTKAMSLPPSLVDSWDVWTPEQQQHCSNWLRLLLGVLRCVRAWRQESQQQKRGPLLRLLVCNAIAALEEDRRLASGAPDVLLQAATAAAALPGAGGQLGCSADLALPWLQVAAAEETVTGAAEGPRGSLWWPAVYLAFRSGDILCLLSLGAGPFLPSTCCSFAAAASAAIAAAAADPSAVAQQQHQLHQQHAVCFREFGMYPPMLPFLCRQLVVLLLRTSVGAVKRNAADKEGQRAADALNAFVAAIPDSTALTPEATTARGWSDCFVLYPPPQQQQQEQEEHSRQKDAAQATDPHLLLLLSLLRPDLWPPLKLSEILQQVTQEDFLHYRLMLLLAQAQQQQQPLAEASLLRGLRALVGKVKLQGPLFFDPHQQQQLSVAALDELPQQQQHYGWTDPQQRIAAALHVNFTYAWLLTLCGGVVDALLWLLRTYPFMSRVAMLLLMLCYKFGCFESAGLLHLSSDSLHEAAQAACIAAACPGGIVAGAPDTATGIIEPWTDEAWALEWQERGTPSEGPLADFLAQDLAATIGSTFGCTDTSLVRLANRLVFAGSPAAGTSGELACDARPQLKAVLLSAMDTGLAGSDPLAKVTILSLLPLFWSVPLLPAVIREAFGTLTKPGILMGDSDAAEGDLPPGLLEAILLRHQPQQQLRPQQQRFLSDICRGSGATRDILQYRLEQELWGSYFVLLDADSSSCRKDSAWADFDSEAITGGSGSEELLQRRQELEERPFLFLLYCALRQEARRRGDLRNVFAASWLMTDERSAADALADALSSQLFNDFALEANHQRRDMRAFFLRAFNVLKRSSTRVPRKLDLLAARGLFLSLLSSERFFDAMHAFNNMQLQLRLLPDTREEIPAYFAAPYDARLIAGLLDALVFLLQQLLAQGYLLENLLPFERLLTFQLVAAQHLSTSDSPHLEATRSVLTELAMRYRA